MKKLVLVAFVILGAGFASAQSKIAHVNTQEIMEAMPSYKEALNKMETFDKQANTELQTMQTDLDKTYQEAIKMIEIGVLTYEEQRSKEQEVSQMQQDLQERTESLQTEGEAYSEELNQSILKKIEKAMKIVSDRVKYDYVFDVSKTMIHNGPDITKQVITEILKLE